MNETSCYRKKNYNSFFYSLSSVKVTTAFRLYGVIQDLLTWVVAPCTATAAQSHADSRPERKFFFFNPAPKNQTLFLNPAPDISKVFGILILDSRTAFLRPGVRTAASYGPK